MLKGGSAYISVKGGGVSTPRSEAVMNSRAISSMLQLAATTAAAGKLEETETHYNQALQLCIDTPSIGKEHKLAVHAYVGLAHVALRRGFLDQSEDNYTNALRSAEKTLGASDPQTITILGDLAMTQRRRGRLLDAERLLRQAIERHNSISNPTQQNELIKLNYTCNLADVLREKGEKLF
jgi:tetratricopeptide (TPR) repeat protein